MKLLKFENLTNGAKIGTLVSACAFAISCTKGGSISGGGSTSAVSGSITLSKTYPTASGSSWTPVTSGSRTYIKGLSITIEGVCSRGIASIKVNEGGSDYTETATCASDGSFSWNKTYTAVSGEGDKNLHFSAYDADGAVISEATASELVRIDNTNPNAPVITTPGPSDQPTDHYNGDKNYVDIVGTVDATDVDHLTGPGGVVITQSAGIWTYRAYLTAGSSKDFTFTAWDTAGNHADAAPLTIIWAPTVDRVAGGTISGGTIADSGASGFTLDATQEAASAVQSDSVSGFSLATGFNYIINLVRGL